MSDDQDWQRRYCFLALRLNRLLHGSALLYYGPAEWQSQVAAEEPTAAELLIDEADELLADADSPHLVAHLDAMKAVARFTTGQPMPFGDLVDAIVGLPAEWIPETIFEHAHELLDRALPPRHGSLAERYQAWQRHYSVTDLRLMERLVLKTDHECRVRTRRILGIEPDDAVDCQVVSDAHFHFAGLYRPTAPSTIFVNAGRPFNVADLIYNVAHESHPGHIAETRTKIRRATRLDQRIRFLFSPSLALGEGIGLAAESVIFPGTEATEWLRHTVLPDTGIEYDGSDVADIHLAKNMLWGVWANAALMAAEGRANDDIADYLAQWALYDDDEITAVVPAMKPSPMSAYYLSYFHTWNLVRHLAADAGAMFKLLTEHWLPRDVTRLVR